MFSKEKLARRNSPQLSELRASTQSYLIDGSWMLDKLTDKAEDSRTTRSHRPLIKIEQLRKVFVNGTVALDGINLTIPSSSQFLSVLGPSGCGKSTLLRLIAGLERPTSGTIDWPTTVHDAQARPRPELGYVFQDPTLMPWATVFNNLYLPLRIKGLRRSAAREQILNALRQVGLQDFADTYPRELSGGMRMRASVARAIVTRPRVMLMDEPFAALDEITRLKLDRELLELWQTYKLTVIFVTHSVFESVFLADRIVVMGTRPGRIVADLCIDEPYPRADSFRMSTTYNEHCRQVSEALARSMGEE
jgi:NitT/TauT family transport system ATP-binding protein